MMAFVAVLLLSPQFASVSSSVGGDGNRCYPDIAGNAGVQIPTSGECCDTALLIGNVGDDGCPNPSTVPEVVAPAPVFVPQPIIDVGPIIGPIWLGAIQPSVTPNGTATLQFPFLLARFIENKAVRVYDANGTLVYHGAMGAGDRVTIPNAGPAPHTVVTYLRTGSKYTEVVGTSSTS